MNIDGTSCIIEMWGSFVQTLFGVPRWQQSVKPGVGPSMPRKPALYIDRLNMARVSIECGPETEILARALGPLGTLSDEAPPLLGGTSPLMAHPHAPPRWRLLFPGGLGVEAAHSAMPLST